MKKLPLVVRTIEIFLRLQFIICSSFGRLYVFAYLSEISSYVSQLAVSFT